MPTAQPLSTSTEAERGRDKAKVTQHHTVVSSSAIQPSLGSYCLGTLRGLSVPHEVPVMEGQGK